MHFFIFFLMRTSSPKPHKIEYMEKPKSHSQVPDIVQSSLSPKSLNLDSELDWQLGLSKSKGPFSTTTHSSNFSFTQLLSSQTPSPSPKFKSQIQVPDRRDPPPLPNVKNVTLWSLPLNKIFSNMRKTPAYKLNTNNIKLHLVFFVCERQWRSEKKRKCSGRLLPAWNSLSL